MSLFFSRYLSIKIHPSNFPMLKWCNVVVIVIPPLNRKITRTLIQKVCNRTHWRNSHRPRHPLPRKTNQAHKKTLSSPKSSAISAVVVPRKTVKEEIGVGVNVKLLDHLQSDRLKDRALVKDGWECYLRKGLLDIAKVTVSRGNFGDTLVRERCTYFVTVWFLILLVLRLQSSITTLHSFSHFSSSLYLFLSMVLRRKRVVIFFNE